jgi:hypothetical protein
MPSAGRHVVCKEGKPSFGGVGHGVAPLSFSRGNDGAFVKLASDQTLVYCKRGC